MNARLSPKRTGSPLPTASTWFRFSTEPVAAGKDRFGYPVGQEIRKLPLGEISLSMSGDQSIAVAAGSNLQRPLWPAVSTGRRKILNSTHVEGVLRMKQRPRIYYTKAQKALMWDRWQKGESMASIARLFDRGHSSIQGIFAATGGIWPAFKLRPILTHLCI